ncbi:MerR family transcriptional regulator [Streptomyces triticagri]|uniref:MerR family transcriptional regulator n=1 Tax=Streptomyces triticagri TaxID=2293568 RepID=UPI001F4806C5|nr:MerR family transcriptional regulator [Streptomyces triticagri]
MEDLAQQSGATVRTIRAYQDRGLLPRPERRGRANVYGPAHLTRLHQIADLLERGYTLASIKELLEAWDTGRGLGGVLGLAAEIDGPWTDEKADRITLSELAARFSVLTPHKTTPHETAPHETAPHETATDDSATQPTGRSERAESAGAAESTLDESALQEAIALGILERIPGRDDEFLVPSPQELSVAVELHSAGVPLSAISGHLRELRGQVEHIAARFLEFTTEHVFARYLGHSPPSDAEAAEVAALVRRLRPLAQHTLDAELARAMRKFANHHLRHHLGTADAPAADLVHRVPLPGSTIEAVRALVGDENAPRFIALAAEREVAARTLDAYVPSHGSGLGVDQIP